MARNALLVDDSRIARMITRSVVAKLLPDWSIVDVENADEALTKVDNQAFDLMLIDVNMPGRDGIDLASEMIERFPSATIALITANIQASTRDKAKALGVGFIEKPIKEEKLAAFLSEAEV